MNDPKNSLADRRGTKAATVLAVISLAVIGGHPLRAESLKSADDGRGVLRYDPIIGKLVPISPEKPKPGHVYSHFSKRLNRRVWSYVQSNGQFWYALGEGTTQEAWRLDIRGTMEERMGKLAELAPGLYSRLQREGERRVFVRLTSDHQWVIAEGARFPTVFNAETGYRWERLHGQYRPVSSGPGRYRWVAHRGKYVPAERFRGTASRTGRVAPLTPGGCRCD